MILAFVYVDRASQGAGFPLEYIDEEQADDLENLAAFAEGKQAGRLCRLYSGLTGVWSRELFFVEGFMGRLSDEAYIYEQT